MFDEWKEFYETHGFLPSDVSRRTQRLNEIQLHSQYDKYCEAQRRAQKKHDEGVQDERWISLLESIDLTFCQLHRQLRRAGMNRLWDTLIEHSGGFHKIIDPAHVIRRSVSKALIYEPLNIVPLNRYSHSMLDSYRSPITGERIDKDRHDEWWLFIVGRERFNKLKERIQ